MSTKNEGRPSNKSRTLEFAPRGEGNPQIDLQTIGQLPLERLQEMRSELDSACQIALQRDPPGPYADELRTYAAAVRVACRRAEAERATAYGLDLVYEVVGRGEGS